MASRLAPRLAHRCMNAVEISKPGGPEVLTMVQLPVPQLAEGQVLIKTQAAGVNRPDVIQRQGLYPAPKGHSPIPGLEVAGTIAASRSSKFREGDSVCALTNGGGYAEFVAVPDGQVLPVPDGMEMTAAACLPETFFTVWHNVFQRGLFRMPPNKRPSLLVHGGASGIGTTAIQLGAAKGLEAGSDEKCELCKQLGAHHAINYKTAAWEDEISSLTGGKGVNMILDMVAGDYTQPNINSLTPDGMLAIIAFLRGPKTNINLIKVMTNRLTITGSTLRARPDSLKAEIAGELLTEVWPMLESGSVAPVVDSKFDLADAAAAHIRMEESLHFGKIVLSV